MLRCAPEPEELPTEQLPIHMLYTSDLMVSAQEAEVACLQADRKADLLPGELLV